MKILSCRECIADIVCAEHHVTFGDTHCSNFQNQVEEKFKSTNTQSAAIAKIAADIEEWAVPPVGRFIRIQPCVLRRWARQLRAL